MTRPHNHLLKTTDLHKGVRCLVFDGFPRGNLFLLGQTAERVLAVHYTNANREDDILPPESYLHIGDRLILARDCWPKTDPDWTGAYNTAPVRVDIVPAKPKAGRWT